MHCHPDPVRVNNIRLCKACPGAGMQMHTVTAGIKQRSAFKSQMQT